MRKILLIICAILTTTSVHATQMCARRDTTVIPLDSIIQGKTNDYWNNPNEWIWSSGFEYGRIYGVATCLSLQDIRDIEDDQTLDETKKTLVTDEDEIMGRSDYYQGNKTDNNLYERNHCYCKLTHPMSSLWLSLDSSSAANCKSNCAYGCSARANSYIDWRPALFNVIGYGYVDINEKIYDTSIDLN